MRRREFIVAGLGSIAAAGVAALTLLTPSAAQTPPVRRIGLLRTSAGAGLGVVRSVVMTELERLGFIEGRDIALELRAGTPEQMPDLARELAVLNPVAILAVGGAAVAAMASATRTIPIVTFGPDVGEAGLAQSLSRPGGNVTGIVILARELDAKRLELLHEAVPSARRFAVLVNSSSPGSDASRREIGERAAKAGTDALFFDATGGSDYAAAFAAMRAAGVQGLAINANPIFAIDAARLVELALSTGLPTICQWREMAEQGCFLSYGPSLTGLYRRAAAYIDRILKGGAPGDMPVEQPMKFELVINLKTARALGLTIPATLLARADEVIE
jgi:putative tryptophan/tyrosine transport system substrate-binding protein